MWILINALQFIVFIGMWLINMPSSLRQIFDQLKRIVTGEFLEDLQIGKNIAEGIGLESEDKGGLD